MTPLRYKTDTLDIPPLPRPSAKLLSTGVPTLEVLVPTRGGAEHDLVLDIASGSDQIIGRDDSADITVPEPTISRHHARITRDTDGVWVEDLDSTNGTYVNGRRVLDRSRLRDSDEVKLGSAVAVFHEVPPAPDATESVAVVRDVLGPPDSTGRHEAVTEVPGATCPHCSSALGSDMSFCHRCGNQRGPIAMPQAALGQSSASIIRHRLIDPHGNIRSQTFRRVMRSRNGGRRPMYNESLALPALVLRGLLLLALIAGVVAAFVVLGMGVHHFVHLRQQPVGRSVTGHSHFTVPTKFKTRMG